MTSLGSLEYALNKGVPAWVPRGADGRVAIKVVDAANDRGWFAGRAYGSEADMLIALAAMGDGQSVATKSGLTRTVGNYVASDAAELMVNGDMSAGADGWFATSTGSVSVIDGELVVDGGGGNSTRGAHAFASALSKGYRLRATYRRGTTASNVSALASSSAAFSPATNSAASNNTTVAATNSKTFGSEHGSTMYAGVNIGGNPANGTAIADNFSVKECAPFAGFNTSAISGEIEFVTPSTAATVKVLRQLDDDGARSRVRLEYGTDQIVRLIVTYGNSAQASLALGSVALETAGKVEWTVAANRVAARLEGQASLVDTAVVKPGLTYDRIGRSNTGETWDGQITKDTLFNGERIPADMGYFEGDSYVAGAGGVGLYLNLIADTAYRGFSTAVGGSTIQEQLARVQANPGLCRRGLFIHWDGRHNGWVDLATYMAAMTAMVAAYGGSRHLLLPPVAVPGDSVEYIAETVAIRDAMIAAFGAGHVLDWRDMLTLDGSTVAASELADGIHLTDAAMDKIVVGVAAWIAAL